MDRRGHVSLCLVNVTWIDLDSFALILHFLNQFSVASRSVCSFCEAMAESLSMVTTAVSSLSMVITAVSSAKFSVVDPSEVGRSAVYSRYNNGHVHESPSPIPILNHTIQSP
jgi:hypothetical protein